jgi:DNA polymerase-4
VTLKLRYGDFTTITRSLSGDPAVQEPEVMAARALALLDRTDAGRRPVRLLGVSAHNLTESPGPSRPAAWRDGMLPLDPAAEGAMPSLPSSSRP